MEKRRDFSCLGWKNGVDEKLVVVVNFHRQSFLVLRYWILYPMLSCIRERIVPNVMWCFGLFLQRTQHPNATHAHRNTKTTTSTSRQWPEQSKLHTSQLGERPHAITLQQRLHKSKLDTQGAWRNSILTALGPLLFAKSVNTRRTLTFWSEMHPSSILSKRLLPIWSRICECRAPPFLPSRRLQKHTLFASLKTAMSVQSMQSVWWSRQKTSS